MDSLRSPSSQDKRKTITISIPTKQDPVSTPVAEPQTNNNPVQEIETVEDLDQLITSSHQIILDCFAAWCGPCKKIAPVFEQFAKTHNKTDQPVSFAKCDIEKVTEVTDRYGVTKLPTFLIIKDGKVIDTIVGTSTPFQEMVDMHFSPSTTSTAPGSSTNTTSTPTPTQTPILASPAPSLYVAPRTTTTPTEEAQNVHNPEVMTGSSLLNLPPRPQELIDLINSLSTYHLVFFYSSTTASELPTIYSPTRLQPFGVNDSGPSSKTISYNDIIDDLQGICQKTKATLKPVSFTAVNLDEQPSLAKEFNVTEKNGPVVKLFYKKVPFITFERCANAKNVEAKFPDFLAL